MSGGAPRARFAIVQSRRAGHNGVRPFNLIVLGVIMVTGDLCVTFHAQAS